MMPYESTLRAYLQQSYLGSYVTQREHLYKLLYSVMVDTSSKYKKEQ